MSYYASSSGTIQLKHAGSKDEVLKLIEKNKRSVKKSGSAGLHIIKHAETEKDDMEEERE